MYHGKLRYISFFNYYIRAWRKAFELTQTIKVPTRDTWILDWCLTNLPE